VTPKVIVVEIVVVLKARTVRIDILIGEQGIHCNCCRSQAFFSKLNKLSKNKRQKAKHQEEENNR
jgi:hypothetical protein